MSDSHTLDDFFADGLGDAFAEGASRALPEGTYRWKILAFVPELGQRNGVPVKDLTIRGINADTGEPIVRTWRLTSKDGSTNRIQATMLMEQMIRAGLRKSVKDLAEDCTGIPIVSLVISSRAANDGKVYADQALAKCEDQTLAIAAPEPAKDVSSEAPF